MKTMLATAALAAGLAGTAAAGEGLAVGTQAPVIEFKDWFNQAKKTSHDDLAGRVLYVEFWRTW